MKIKPGYLFAIAGAAALSACNTYAGAGTGVGVGTNAAVAGMPGVGVTQQAFVHMAAANSAFEIQAAQLATPMSTDPQVRAYAQKMINDHTMATQTLQRAAAEARVPIDMTLTAEQQASLSALRSAGTAANFNALYKQQMMLSHERAYAMLQVGAQMNQWQALQGWARAHLPIIQNHLMMARQLP
ncbi:DUF4142 domain-containing protein [Altericroceibacterium xinjiangense]|uniref:DUF4142 domain-containing protein n=1 Tax=Altericroceibacterium xinjiangense TaxID=762261 RepID=UPI000F7F83FA|nr:DUF4142 domain-containing protein [Altericroceibacterium xinjiangense]